jgi:NAD(P)-dependent dehydrogenase (short-subunit alcohol dehydrogenase family)
MPQLVWLVTGCSSGLGEELVHAILARGDLVVATGRNAAEKLSHLKNTGATILDIDVTAPQAELDAKIAEALAIYGGIDVLVPNAGYSECGLVEDLRQVIMVP